MLDLLGTKTETNVNFWLNWTKNSIKYFPGSRIHHEVTINHNSQIVLGINEQTFVMWPEVQSCVCVAGL